MTLDRAEFLEALPQYELEGELGRGAWGVVLRGRHRRLNRRVAIKQLPRAFSNDPGVRRRFQREAQVLASLEHTNIVTVYDYVEHDGICFIVMEFLPGGSLSKRVQSQGLTIPSACAVALAASHGLRVAHARNILHRDIKPENLLFSSKGAIKITDFGLAKIVSGEQQPVITQAGYVLGTPAYMAPEQALGQELTTATDVYALATVLYELLAGRLPYPSSGDTLAILHSHAYDPPAPLSNYAPGLPSVLHDLVMRGIANDPKDRYLTAAEFGAALNEATASKWGPAWRTSSETAEILGGDFLTGATGDQSEGTCPVTNTAETVEHAKPTASTMVVRRSPPISPSEPTPASERTFSSASTVASDLGHQTTEVSPAQNRDSKTATSRSAPSLRPRWRPKMFWGAALVLLLVIGVWSLVSYLTRVNHLPQASNVGTVLPPGGVLKSGQEMTSPNDRYALLMQNDGNLVEYDTAGPVWASGTSGNRGAYALVQPEGNLVIYPKGVAPPPRGSRTTPALWASSTDAQFAGVSLRLDNSGRVRLVLPQSNAIAWQATS